MWKDMYAISMWRGSAKNGKWKPGDRQFACSLDCASAARTQSVSSIPLRIISHTPDCADFHPKWLWRPHFPKTPSWKRGRCDCARQIQLGPLVCSVCPLKHLLRQELVWNVVDTLFFEIHKKWCTKGLCRVDTCPHVLLIHLWCPLDNNNNGNQWLVK